KKLEFNQLLNNLDVESVDSGDTELDIEVQTLLNAIDFTQLASATIHFEIDGSNYLKDDMLKFGIYAQDQHVVVDAQEVAAHDALVKWLE
ncbi:hypothetical protein, partial [Dorea formicigenerans]